MISATNLHKSYGQTQVLKGIDFTVQEGEVVAIIGPSGSGKTTLLRSLNSLEIPDKGELTIGDATIQFEDYHKKDLIKLRQQSSMVFQHYHLFQNKRALENITEGLIVSKNMSKKEAEKIGEAFLSRIGLLHKKDAFPSELSGGQQQRIGIARALAINPAVLLFDEPTSALDPEMVGEILEMIKDIARQGMTMVIVTHEISFAKDVADTVIFMADGEIIEKGSPQEVLVKPTHERTKQFLSRIHHGMWESAGPEGDI
ncbi:amino acid ABC transporter ATP-binding protein [Bacillus sp. 179-C3.3 HS]|uniref:amino acid ABC transporter ATP-binding protein n=1 Tax=Bacillus sp. 179-C3.3 HS TaxID=3232162 RepID=UPI00399FE5C6